MLSYKSPLLYCTLLLCLTSLSFSSEIDNPYTIANNSITINTYKSSINQSERSNYYYWIGLRNSFYYSQSEGKLAKLVKYFIPEDESYYPSLYKFGSPFFALGCLIIVCLIAYLFLRFICKGCQGPKKSNTDDSSWGPWALIIIGFLISAIFFTMGLYYAAKQNGIVNSVTTYVDSQRELLESEYNKMIANQDKINSAPYPTTDKGFVSKISHIEEITAEKEHLKTKYENFSTDVHKLQSPKFSFEIAFYVLLYILTAAGVVGYWSRREWIPWIASFLILCFTVPVLLVIGLEASYALLSIDFCQTIGNSINSATIPADSKGLGTYFSCPLKEARRGINTAIYEFSTSFNYLADEINKTLHENGTTLGMYKRNNSNFEEMKTNFTDNVKVINGLNNMIDTNNILAGLLHMSACATADNSINYIEENFCHPLFHHMAYNILYYFIGVIGLIMLGVGLNKLITVMRRNAAHALRGNKKFNDELEDDDM